MAEFNYKLEDGKYTLYKDGKPLTNPHGIVITTDKHGIVITTDNEELAKKMEEALKKRKGYSSPKSILTYHYTYCNLKESYGQEFVVNDFSESANYDALMGDNYLMFRQPSPVRQAIAVYFEKELPECFKMYNLYQLTAVLVVEAYVKHLKEIGDMIDTFVYYFTLGV